MNAERLNKVADMIQAYPEHFDMASYLDGPDYTNSETSTPEAVMTAPLTSPVDCGTTACIAGWACHLWASEVVVGEPFDANAARILGLDDDQSYEVFYVYAAREDAAASAGYLRRMALEAEFG